MGCKSFPLNPEEDEKVTHHGILQAPRSRLARFKILNVKNYLKYVQI